MLIVSLRCCNCGERHTWHSQPNIGNLCAGNLLLSVATFFAGATIGGSAGVFTHGSEDVHLATPLPSSNNHAVDDDPSGLPKRFRFWI